MQTDNAAQADLLTITIDDKPRFDRALSALRDPISDYTFSNIYMWSGGLRLSWRLIHRHVCVFANSTGDLTMLVPPLAEPDATEDDLPRAIGACFEIMDAYNDRHADRSRSRIEYVSDELLERINAARSVTLSAAPLWSDYVYRCDRMIDLAGGDLKSKRHARSKFVNTWPDHRTQPLTAEHVLLCEQLLGVWSSRGDEAHEGEITDAETETNVLRERDRLATTCALREHAQLGLTGMTLWVDDQLVGFTLGEELGEEQASVLIEKTHPDHTGAPQFIFSEFCRTCWSHRPLINAGDDWGIPGLRYTKQSYRPVRVMSKHVLTASPAALRAEGAVIDLAARNPPHLISTGSSPLPDDPSMARADHSIRPGRPEDADAILGLEQESFAAEKQVFTRRQIRALLSNPRAIVLVAEDADAGLVAWSVGLIRRHTHPRSGATRRSARLYSIAVAASARGRGIGRALTNRCVEAFRDSGAQRAFLEVRATNEPAISLYRSLGFEARATLPNYYAMGVDGIRMSMPLVSEASPEAAPKPVPGV